MARARRVGEQAREVSVWSGGSKTPRPPRCRDGRESLGGRRRYFVVVVEPEVALLLVAGVFACAVVGCALR